jgi:hypothetical protein
MYLAFLGHQGTYSDLGTTGDALASHNPASLFMSTWNLVVIAFLIIWGALFIIGRRNQVTDKKPKRMPDIPPNDEGGVGGLN